MTLAGLVGIIFGIWFIGFFLSMEFADDWTGFEFLWRPFAVTLGIVLVGGAGVAIMWGAYLLLNSVRLW